MAKKFLVKIIFIVFCLSFIFLNFGAQAEIIKEPRSAKSDSVWQYRQSVYISNLSSENLIGYQVPIVLDTRDLISKNKMNSDCGDLRFVDPDSLAELSHWLESGCGNASTKIWVKAPLIRPNSSRLIYAYYGNSWAKSSSSGGKTFDFFDDFSDGDYFNNPVWTKENNCTFKGGDINIIDDFPQNKVLQMTRTSTSCGAGVTASLVRDYGVWHALLKKSAGVDGNGVQFYLSYGGNGDYVLFIDSGEVRLSGPNGQIGPAYRQPAGKWHVYDVTRNSNGDWNVYIDGMPRITGTDNIGTINAKIGVRTTSWAGSKTDYADNIFFRKYAYPEPESNLYGEDFGNFFLPEQPIILQTPSPSFLPLPTVIPTPTFSPLPSSVEPVDIPGSKAFFYAIDEWLKQAFSGRNIIFILLVIINAVVLAVFIKRLINKL